MARPRNDDVRRQIILATFDCIAREGVSGMSLREVARVTGASTGTVNYHFGSRRGLLLDAIDYGYWNLPEDLKEMAADDAMRWVLNRYELSDESRRTWWRFWLAVTSHAQSDADVAERLHRQHNSILDRWRECLDKGKRSGTFADDIDAAAEAERLAAYAHGLAVTQLIDPSTTQWAGRELARALDSLSHPRSRYGREVATATAIPVA